MLKRFCGISREADGIPHRCPAVESSEGDACWERCGDSVAVVERHFQLPLINSISSAGIPGETERIRCIYVIRLQLGSWSNLITEMPPPPQHCEVGVSYQSFDTEGLLSVRNSSSPLVFHRVLLCIPFLSPLMTHSSSCLFCIKVLLYLLTREKIVSNSQT